VTSLPCQCPIFLTSISTIDGTNGENTKAPRKKLCHHKLIKLLVVDVLSVWLDMGRVHCRVWTEAVVNEGQVKVVRYELEEATKEGPSKGCR
jgi:hypothetical protein